LKTEFLILVPSDESFCNSKKAFVDFLKVETLLSVSNQKISYRRTTKGREIVSAKFRVETNMVQSKKERYFHLVLECQDDSLVDEFSELCEKIKSISGRIHPGATAINTIWDDIGRIYAEKSYPLINEVENLMRKLIAKFMLINVGMTWSKDAINPELFKKIEDFNEEEIYLNDLYKLDFIHLEQVLFEKKRDISLDELDRLLQKTNFDAEDKEKILKYVPRSNWEKYFSSLIDEKDSSFKEKWKIIYKLRNKVAHNRNITKSEFNQIKGLSLKIKDIINNAIEKLGEIDLNEEDRELIIYSYNSESPAAIGFLSEKAVAEYYTKLGFEVITGGLAQRYFDFLALKDSEKVAVEIKNVHPRRFMHMIRMVFERQIQPALHTSEIDSTTKIHLICVLRDEDSDYPTSKLYSDASRISEQFGEKLEIFFGMLNEENEFTIIDR